MKPIAVEGRAGFNNLTEARGFKGEDTKKTFGMELVLTQAEADALLKTLEPIVDKLYAEKVESEKARGRKIVVRKPVSLKDTPEGELKITFKRKEEEGAPPVVTKDGSDHGSFVKRGTRIKVAFEPVPYVMQGVFGVSMKLRGVQVLDEVMRPADLMEIFGEAGVEVKAPATKDLF